MIVTCISDTHELHREVELPAGDLLIHAGDITFFSRKPSTLQDFNEWLGEQPYRYRIVVPGNHDTLLENPEVVRTITNAHVLINSGVVVGGLKVWGSPATNLSSGAFAEPDEAKRMKIWRRIPSDTDVLVTHIPPARILDGGMDENEYAGCPALRREFRRLKAKLHIFGHVHSAQGTCATQKVMFVNASLSGQHGDIANDPVQLKLVKEPSATDLSQDREPEPPKHSRSLLV